MSILGMMFFSVGIKNTKNACCGSGKFNGENFWVKFFSPDLRSNITEYLFWDLYHPSQDVAQIAASSFYPIIFSQLME